MPISRNRAGTVFVTGAPGLTPAALAYPAMLGVQSTSGSPDRKIGPRSRGD
ncbi:hypothetical protein [Streptomyces sp. NPDC093149]|uniref:hypothetical protein n=1 Tax=Streptomyces sp. NPDC093149 TaxID=3366031 RepID=UPI00380F0409